MESVSAQVVATAKLPEVILNGDSPLPTRTIDGVETSVPLTTAEQKLARKNELKARGTLLMALPNEHQLKFNTYKSAKTLMEAIEKRFEGNKESKKVHKTLLKQQYENFNGKSSEGLDHIYDRMQKLISQLEIHGETISQEDVYLKLLRSLLSEWKTHTLIWRNKPDLEDLSMDDFTVEAVKTAHGVSAANSTNNASTLSNVDSLSDAMIYSFFACQSNSSQLDKEYLKQIDLDDLEEMDLKWQMVMLTIRTRRFLKKTGRNLGVNGTDTIGFDKTKVKCYNCHRRGHFARECKTPKNQDSRNRETTKRTMPAEEGPTNFALMAYTSSSSSSSDTEVSTCSKACLKSYETLKEHYDNLTKDFNKSQLNVGAYKAGLESVEARLDVYKKNEAIFEEDIKILKLDIMLRDNALIELRKKFEKDEKERDDLKLTLEKFKNSSKNLSKFLDSQICDKFKSGVGYDSQVFDSQVFDSQVNDSESATSVPSAATSEVKTSVSKPKSVSEPLIEDWISDSENENETKSKSGQRKPSNAKVEFVKSYEHVKSPRESIKKVENNKQAKYPRKNSQSPRGNKRNWNNLMTQKLGSNFEFKNKACYVCGSFNHLIKDCDFYEKKMVEKPVWNNARRVNHQNSQRITHPHPKRNFVPRAVLMKSGFKTLNTARQSSSRAAVSVNTARPINTAYPRPTVNSARTTSNVFNRAHSHVIRPFNKFTTNKNSNFNEKVNTVRENVLYVGQKQVVRGNLQLELQEKGVIDSGCLRHMTGNKSYLSDYEEIDGGFIAFGGKFDEKADEGFFVGYSVNSKAFRVFNSRNRIIEEALHITFLENKPNVAGSGPEGLFDIDTLTKSMNYKPVVAGNQTNGNAGFKESIDACQAGKKTVPSHEYILLPLWTPDSPISSSLKSLDDKVSNDVEKKTIEDPAKEDDKDDQDLREFERLIVQRKEAEININSTNSVSAVSSPVNTAGTKDADVNSTNSIYTASPLVNFDGLSYFNSNPPDDLKMPNLEDTGIFGGTYDDEDFVAGGDMNNLEYSMPVSPIATTRVHKDHPVEQIIRDLHSAPQTRRMTKNSEEHGLMSLIQKKRRTNHKDFQNCLFSCFLSQVEPKKVIQALIDPSWIEAMQDELLQFKLQKVWTLVDLPYDKRAIGTKWVYRNKKDKRGIVVRNKARLVAQGYTQEKGIDYDEVFALVARIEAISLFLAYASFMNFFVYQMDVEKALYGLHEALRAWYETLSTYLLENGFQRGTIDKTLFIKKVKCDILLVQIYVDDIIFGSTKKELCTEFEKLMHKKFQTSSIGELTFFLGLQVIQKEDGIFISQDKYVDEILKKFGFLTVRMASTPMETSKPLLKDAEAKDVDVYLYRSMIGSLMYLTSSRLDIMFVVCACARFQVTPKVSHLHAVKRIFRYLKCQPKLGLWYPKDSLFDLEAYTDSDYAGASLDRKSMWYIIYHNTGSILGLGWFLERETHERFSRERNKCV
ncbi:putative ribonuclease H-like domain-containing protein [Tanacetum coccineum]